MPPFSNGYVCENIFECIICGRSLGKLAERSIVGKKLKIVHLEMLNIFDALRSALKFFCDNWAVVQVLKTGKTKNAFLGACSHNIWLLMDTYDIDLQIEHIVGKRISMLMHYLEFTLVSM